MIQSPIPTPAPRRGRRLAAVAGVTLASLAFATLTAAPAQAAEVTIAEVQGTGDSTPLSGQSVTVEGVVTGYYGAPSGYRGLYLQSAEPSGVDGASDGLFVYFNNLDPAVEIGDLIQVTGTAGEYQGQTQLTATSAAAYTVVEADAGLPDATPLPDDLWGDDREALEGMLVEPTGEYVLSSSHQLYNFGTLWLSAGGESVQATETTDAGEDAAEIAADNAARRLLVDDGYSIQVTNTNHPGTQPYFSADETVRGGDVFVPAEKPYVLGYGFGDWRLQPQIPLNDESDSAYLPSFEATNPRPDAPEVGGDVRFGSFNVFNYFTTFAEDDDNARGAEDAEEFAIQKSKIVAAITGLGADVIALQELQNTVEFGEPADGAVADLVEGLNAEDGAGTWAFVPLPAALASATGNDVITTGIIYKPAVATPVGESFTDLDAVWSNARKPVGQTFDADGRTITVIANHFKSKSAPDDETPEPEDGQGYFNEDRVAQAERLIEVVDTVAADPAKGSDVILLGDFNSYAQEDPIQALTDAGFVDLVPERAEGQYTYTFDGQLGSLDHALATPSLAESVTGVGVWGINAAEWSDRGYAFGAAEAGTPYRSSDHDPIVAGVDSTRPPVEIDLLSVNDFHGRLEAAAPSAGAAVLAGTVKQYEAENPDTLFVGAGDLIGASTFTSFIQQDQPTIDALNAMGLDASSFGNHEFDKGRADVDDRILEEADWPYLAANIYDAATGEPAYQQYELREVDGVTVGFVGAVTEELPSLVSPAGIEGLEVKQVVPEVNRVADQLSDGDPANGEADVVVLLVHEGAATTDIASATDDSAFGRIVTGADANVDMIVSGHTHLAYDHDIPIPGTDRTRPVISAGQYGEKYARSTITVDPATGELVEPIDTEILDLVGAADPDPEVAEIVADAVATADELGSVSLGSVTTDIRRAVQSNGTAENRGGESTIGNLIADVQLEATADLGTEVAIMNPGGIRTDLVYASSGAGDPDGNVTYKEAAVVQPFANTLVTLDLTGAQLTEVLEQQWQPAGSSRPFLKLGVSAGLEYVYDLDAPAGEHITAITLGGEPVTDDQVISVVTNSFLAAGGDNFTAFTEGSGKADSGRIDLDAFVDYLADNSPVAPDLAQRAVGATISAPADGAAYQAGETVALDLSSLLFSNAGAKTGDVTVSLDGTELASAPLTFTIVDTVDEQGTATVEFTVPDGLEGTQVLTIAGPGGTEVELPIEVAAAPDPIVTKAAGSATRLLSFGGKNVSYRVAVTAADGSEPVGAVTIFDNGKALTTADLEAGDGGRATVKLPNLRGGVHILRAEFAGDGFVASRTGVSVVVVIR